MAIAKIVFLNRALIDLIAGISASLIIFSAGASVVAETPIVLTDSKILSVGFNECRSRATKAANFLLKEVTTSEERNLRFKITGTSNETVAVIFCIERSQGTIAIITTCTYGKENHKEGSSLYGRLTDFITRN